MAPGTPLLPFLSQQRGELDVPPAQRLMADLNPTLLESFLNITLAEGKALVELQGVLCDAQRKAVAVWLAIRHRRSAYRA